MSGKPERPAPYTCITSPKPYRPKRTLAEVAERMLPALKELAERQEIKEVLS